MKNLPLKWFICRDSSNYLELNPLLQKINGREYTGRGYALYKIDGVRVVQESDVFCFPPYEKQTYIYKYPPPSNLGYQEITLEQLKNSFMSEILKKLPQNWYIEITQENREKVRKWFNDTSKRYSIGAGYGMKNGGKDSLSCPNGDIWTQISDEDFRFHVLKEYNLSDFREGRVVIEKPTENDPLLNSYVKCLDSNNFSVGIQGSNRYITFERNSNLWKASPESGGVPVIKEIKDLYKNEKMNSKEDFRGYLSKPNFNSVAKGVVRDNVDEDVNRWWGSNLTTVGYNFAKNTGIAKYFESIGVLELWFDKVIEKPVTLPKLGGYEGKLEGDYLKYGCQKVHKSLFDSTICKLDYMEVSGTKVTQSEIKQIQEYVAKFG